jgi:hypothetical protein
MKFCSLVIPSGQGQPIEGAASAIAISDSPPLSGLRCISVDGSLILSVEELMGRAEARGIQREVAQEFARTHVHFMGQVMFVEELYRRKNPMEYGAWAELEAARIEGCLLAMRGCEPGADSADADAAARYRSVRVTFGEWGLETRFEVMAAADSLAPLGLMKLRVLSRRGEPFLVIVDCLCRSERAGAGAGPVGSALLRCVMDSFPGCRVALCTVRPSVPAPFAQTHEAHARAERFYERSGFVQAGDDLLGLLRWIASEGRSRGSPPPGEGLLLLALTNEEELLDSLPGLECHAASKHRSSKHRAIKWFEHAGVDGAGVSRLGSWRRGIAAADPAAAFGGSGTASGASGWLEPWMHEGAMVEVKCEGDWWNAKVLSVRGGLVLVFYVGGKISQVAPALSPLFLPCVRRNSLGEPWRGSEVRSWERGGKR